MNLAAFLSLDFGPPRALGGFTFVPLLAKPASLPALLLDLLEDGHTTVKEVDESGRVNEILVEHRGPHALLLLDGEQVVGAKQNRIVNASFVVPSGAPTAIPVSCVERGRWRHVTSNFAAAESTIAASLRARKLSRVAKNVREKGTYDADQGEVWREVDAYLHVTKTVSATAAYEDGVREQKARIDRELETLAPIERQVGVALLCSGKLALLEVLGSPALYAKAWRKIARGLLAEAAEGEATADVHATLRRALDQLSAVEVSPANGPGCGRTVHGESAGQTPMTVGAVLYERALVHLLAAAA